MPGTGVFGGTGICHLEGNTAVSDRGTLYSAIVSIAAVFYIVLEFCKIGCADSGGAAIGRCSGSMGICCVSGKRENLLFTTYVVLMLLPFQVTMLSSYLILNKLQLLNTHWAVILPAVFNTFPVFVTYGGFRAIPKALIEAARIDGAGELYIFFRIGLGIGRSGILSSMVLGFLEYWNIIEQPFAFLEDKFLWPLSLYLPEIDWTQAGFAFAASVIMLIPAIFVFVMGQDYLEQGIVYSGMKV